MFEALHCILLTELNAAGLIDWTRPWVDASLHNAFVSLTCGPICWRRLNNLSS
ncbi:hypothetical protein P3T37_002068 [Kitasatospora sp. MAA4]|nr:hypothetical protein [Kitasatospora sp. MAA4]